MDYVSDETWLLVRTWVNHAVDWLNHGLEVAMRIPGASIVRKYVHNSYRNDPWRLFLEVVLVLILLNYLFHRRFRPKDKSIKLTDKEVNELVRDWEPKPLAPPVTAVVRRDIDELPTIIQNHGTHSVTSENRELVNFAAFNFLGLSGDPGLERVAQSALRKYGVGSCGPPGFYGTIDVHMQLEKAFAKFVQAEEAILYSFGFATIASVIPAFAKRGDLIISDESVSFATLKGLLVSRAQIKYFKHNDVKDLERILKEVQAEDRKSKKPVTRRFIVIEGLYQNYGDIAPLKEIVALKFQYKYRLIVEESLSMGVLGKTGRGLTEHAGVPAKDVDAITTCFANAFAAAGGLCAGPLPIVDHQRLSGQGYCYSASMPALLAATGLESLHKLETHPEWLDKLRSNVALFRSAFKEFVPPSQNAHVVLEGDANSPVLHVRLRQRLPEREAEELLLQDAVQSAIKDGYLFTRSKYVVNEEPHCPAPSIRVAISAAHTAQEIKTAAGILELALKAATSHLGVASARGGARLS